MSDQHLPHCSPNTDSLLVQLASVSSVLTFITILLFGLTFHILNLQKRRLQLRKISIESNAHVAGMQEITWAIAAVKESIKGTDDGSVECREVFESVSRLLLSSERELDVLTRRTTDAGSVLERRKGWKGEGVDVLGLGVGDVEYGLRWIGSNKRMSKY